MGTREYEYNQIHVRIHIIMGSQIPIYYTRGYPFSYPPYAHDEFYTQIPVDMSIFTTHNRNPLIIQPRQKKHSLYARITSYTMQTSHILSTQKKCKLHIYLNLGKIGIRSPLI